MIADSPATVPAPFVICHLDVRLQVWADAADLDALSRLFVDLVGDAPGDRTSARLRLDVTHLSDPVDVLAAITATILEHTPLLAIHAGLVSGSTGLVAIPAPSGAGKSTLTAALVRAGFGYLSDEALAIDAATGRASAFPRPISLAGDVWPLVLADQGTPPGAAEERLVPVSRFGRLAPGGGELKHIILPRRTGGPADLAAGGHGEAALALLERSFNHYRRPAESLATIARVVRGASVWRATYSDAPEMATLIRRAIG